MITTTIVRIAVARFDPTPLIPIFANIDVSAAKIAEPSANKNHIVILLQIPIVRMTRTLIILPIIPQSALLFNPVYEKKGATLSSGYAT